MKDENSHDELLDSLSTAYMVLILRERGLLLQSPNLGS